jgi:aminoglycoside/choline kinase family phosphotransferase
MTKPVKIVETLFHDWTHTKPVSIEPLPESGSYRTYFRIYTANGSVLGVHNGDNRENEAFLYLNRQLKSTGNNVPEVLYADLDKYCYIEQDLGNITLFDHLADLRKGESTDKDIIQIYRQIIDAMPGLQIRSTHGLDYSHCYPRAEFDIQSMMWDMNYFKYCLLKPLKIDFFEQDLEDDFVRIVKWLIEADRNSFMFRDFQSRNIMLSGDELYFIDFQGGRKGPLQYDLASLLFEAKAHLSEEIRQDLLDYYLDLFEQTFTWFDRKKFLTYYYGFVYLRLMQAMGTYGFRGYIERKPVFLQSLPFAVKTLKWLMENKPIPLNLTSLPAVFNRLIELPQLKDVEVKQGIFTITVNSFSYKSGIPQDHSGNGGGFVFDCRCLDNPGRYEEYKELTGRDQSVIDFLEGKPDVSVYIDHVFPLVFKAAEAYINRGFTHLMVSFGCTGGQHRSVFLAEKLAEQLKNNSMANIVLIHHELDRKTKNK